MDPKKANELVLGFDKKLMYGFKGLYNQYEKIFITSGVTKERSDLSWFQECLNRAYWMPRGLIEDDTSFKQIIPYIIIKSIDGYFTYRRKGSEGRLTGKYSIGIGGHLNPQDLLGVMSDVPLNGAKREFWEEIYIEDSVTSDYMLINSNFQSAPNLHLLYDGSDEVGQVHFGLVYIINVTKLLSEKIRMGWEAEGYSWKTLPELKALEDELEGWSQLVVNECL